MGSKRRQPEPKDGGWSDPQAPGSSGASLGDLLRAQGFQASTSDEPAAPTTRVAEEPGEWLKNKLVLQHERKGRKGKTVTRLLNTGLEGPGLEELTRELRRALGCGAHVEESCVVLQGDLRKRAKAWLAKRGAKRVVIGG